MDRVWPSGVGDNRANGILGPPYEGPPDNEVFYGGFMPSIQRLRVDLKGREVVGYLHRVVVVDRCLMGRKV